METGRKPSPRGLHMGDRNAEPLPSPLSPLHPSLLIAYFPSLSPPPALPDEDNADGNDVRITTILRAQSSKSEHSRSAPAHCRVNVVCPSKDSRKH